MQTIRTDSRPVSTLTTEIATKLFKPMSWEERAFFATLDTYYVNGQSLSRLGALVRAGIIVATVNPCLTLVGHELCRIAREEAAKPREPNPLRFDDLTEVQQARQERDDKCRRETKERYDAATDAHPFYYEVKYPWRDIAITVLQKDAGAMTTGSRIGVKTEHEARELVDLLNRTFNAGFRRGTAMLGDLAKELGGMK